MRYLVHVFTKPDGSVEDAMEPFREHDNGEGKWVGEWDYWSVGGRWGGYFEGSDQVTAALARRVESEFPTPYVYLTLEGEWRPAETYVDGDWRDVEGYEQGYKDYLSSVPDDTVVTTVDIHS